jgi:prevent-host-death family protein
MSSPAEPHWQIQDAKQRFSEVIRAVGHDGPQIITRHGEDVAVIIDIAEYRRLTDPAVDLTHVLLGPPYLDDEDASVFADVEAERKRDTGRAIEFGTDE